jgi:hypothetical protein
MSATSICPLRRNRQASRLNLNCCGWFEIIAAAMSAPTYGTRVSWPSKTGISTF